VCTKISKMTHVHIWNTVDYTQSSGVILNLTILCKTGKGKNVSGKIGNGKVIMYNLSLCHVV